MFNEITKSAVLDAMAHPREVNRELVEAYLARRALDYLVGFTLSPVLWRKLPGSRSAGRVQSVALRLICEREAEIEAFKSQEYWTVAVVFATEDGAVFTARLTHLDGRKLEKFDLPNQAAAEAAVAKIAAGAPFHVATVERKTVRRHPFPSFTTSTLQQEASRKLGFSASHTMRLAQRLYEGVDIGGETVGLITYMRTDSVQLSGEAIAGSRRLIEADYGQRYLPEKPRFYTTKAKNAQEAHEAIRPTDLFRRPQDMARHLDGDLRRLYELIWKRTVASQMESAELDQVTVDIAGTGVGLRATGSVLKFDGFLKLYQEDRDDPAEDEEGDSRLPELKAEQPLERKETKPEQHFTQPPPRYSEASLVKRLEELGIGRPSTYASILQVLQDREYVRLDRRRFYPEDRGRIVTAFLTGFFRRYVEYGFTAGLEEQLDDISGGRIDWKTVLRQFWEDFSRRRRRDQGAAHQRGDRRAGCRSRPAFLPRGRRRRRSPRLPLLRRGPAQPEARPLRRLHRLLELSGMPLYPPSRRRQWRWRRGRYGAEGSGPGSRERASRSRSARAPMAITCSSARTGLRRRSRSTRPRPTRPLPSRHQSGGARARGTEGQGQSQAQAGEGKAAQAQARLPAPGHGAVRGRSGPGSGAAGPAPRARPPSRGSRDDHGRHRPLRPLSEAWAGL